MERGKREKPSLVFSIRSVRDSLVCCHGNHDIFVSMFKIRISTETIQTTNFKLTENNW